jgi:preprotein translocase subunit SecD
VNRRPLVVRLAAILALTLAGAVLLATGARPLLGLDLRGGISAVYVPVLAEGEEPPADFEEVLDRTIEVIRARVDSLGVAEPDIARSGTDVVVQLPGATDADRLRAVIGRTAQLEFRPVFEVLDPSSPGYAEADVDCTVALAERPQLADGDVGYLCGPTTVIGEGDAALTIGGAKYLVGSVALTGERIEDAFPVEQSGGFTTSVAFDAEGDAAFAAITGQLACLRDAGQTALLAIVLDGVVESAPSMNPDVICGIGLTDGAVITSGAGDREAQQQAASDLALVLRTGALPITLEASTFEEVSATLGADSLRAGVTAGLIGLLLVGLWLFLVYRWLGLVTLLSLAVFGVLVVSAVTVLAGVGFALTLAGVAGIIVAIGITADSSILFIERIRDELAAGRSLRSAAVKGYESAFRTNLAGNTVTFAAAAVLYALAVGPVRGFALMLGLATLLDLLILATFTRPVVQLLAASGVLTRERLRAPAPVPAGGARTTEPAATTGGAA